MQEMQYFQQVLPYIANGLLCTILVNLLHIAYQWQAIACCHLLKHHTHQLFQLLALLATYHRSVYLPVADQCTLVPASYWPMHHHTQQLLAITSIKLIKAIIIKSINSLAIFSTQTIHASAT